MAHETTVDFPRLQQLTGYDRPSDVARALEADHVRYFRGRKGLWTTIELINAAKGLAPNAGPVGDYSPEIL